MYAGGGESGTHLGEGEEMTVALRAPPHRTHALTVNVLASKRSDQFVVEERPSPEPWKAHANGAEIVKAALRGAQKLRKCGEHK